MCPCIGCWYLHWPQLSSVKMTGIWACAYLPIYLVPVCSAKSPPALTFEISPLCCINWTSPDAFCCQQQRTTWALSHTCEVPIVTPSMERLLVGFGPILFQLPLRFFMNTLHPSIAPCSWQRNTSTWVGIAVLTRDNPTFGVHLKTSVELGSFWGSGVKNVFAGFEKTTLLRI